MRCAPSMRSQLGEVFDGGPDALFKRRGWCPEEEPVGSGQVGSAAFRIGLGEWLVGASVVSEERLHEIGEFVDGYLSVGPEVDRGHQVGLFQVDETFDHVIDVAEATGLGFRHRRWAEAVGRGLA